MFSHKLTDDAELILIEPRHAEELYALIDKNRERLRPWTTLSEIATSVDTERDFGRGNLRQLADGQGFHCGIVYKGELAGGIGMHRTDLRNSSTEIGYWLDANAEGKGLVTAACHEILDHCFNEMGLNRIVLRTVPGNIRSQAVIRRLGGLHEGLQRKSVLLAGKPTDQEIFSILREDWPASAPTGRAFFTHKLDEDSELGLLEPIHAEQTFALVDANRAYLRRYLAWVDQQNSVEDAREHRKKMLHELAKCGMIVAGIWHKGAIAGIIGFHPLGNKCWELGYWLGEQFQGKGLVTKSCMALIRHGFDNLDVNRVQLKIEPDNTRSRGVPERLGFTYEGTLRQSGVSADGEPVDMMVFSLLKDEWKEGQ